MPSTSDDINIRPAHVEDVPHVARLIAPFVRQRQLLPRSNEDLRQLSRHGFVAEAGSKIIGFAAVEMYSKKMAEVQCLAVERAYQRRGVGKRLVQACIQCARDHDILELMVITASDRFLKECGFDYSLPNQKRALFIDPHRWSPG